MDNGFVHICKTGGTTVNSTALGDAQTVRLDHTTAAEARKNVQYTEGVPIGERDAITEHFFLYTIMRNPFEKLVSCYYSTDNRMGERDISLRLRGPNLVDSNGFKLYVQRITGNHNEYNNKSGGPPEPHRHWMPQSWWIKDKEGRVIVDYIGHTETLMKSINEIAEILEVSLSDTGKLSELQRERASKSQWWKTTHYSQHYDDECRKWAEEYYAEDLDFLNVKFERATDKTKF